MQNIKINEFKGFTPNTFDFLINLEFNNNRAWFEENKHKYKEFVLKPFQELVVSLGDFMKTIDPQLDIRPEVGKTISRIYRDIRFSKDKSPYRSSVWIAFKRVSQDWKLEPSYYFEISPSLYRYGMGFFQVPKESLLKLREMIDSESKDFQKIFKLYNSQDIFKIKGDKYKRILDKSKSEAILEWYQRKDIYFSCERKIDKRLFGEELVEDLKQGFELLKPIYGYLWQLKV